ncbi:MAG: hypothetical protein M1820_008788 [Bogoriella megaspora]|nr:MAG: hypothetical protein M1820_008788 [Bogoriella megaspora]
MHLELHVWGPAFGLPSIDSQCIAAVAYLKLVLSQDGWTLVANHDPSISPTNSFPALRDGSQCIAGFHQIVKHLSSNYTTPQIQNLDEELTAQQRADVVSLSTFIESTAQPLLDLSLYASYENYRATTRPAWSAILPWHANYILPQTIHADAKERVAQIGLSTLDFNSSPSDEAPSSQRTLENQIIPTNTLTPKSLLVRPKNTVRALLNDPSHTSRFKLSALTSSLFDPLSNLLSRTQPSQTYLLTSHPTSLDCLALGYLSLMLSPPVPNPFLRDTLTQKYPHLADYTKRMTSLCFTDSPLPWSSPPSSSNPFTAAKSLLSGLLAPFPGSAVFAPPPRILPPKHADSTIYAPTLLGTYLPQMMGLLVGGLGVMGYVALGRWGVKKDYDEVFVAPRRGAGGGLGATNEAGALLAALGSELRAERAWRENERVREEEERGRRLGREEQEVSIMRAEVDVEVEKVE